MDLKKAFEIAEKQNTAIGHFNVSNLETFEAVVRAGKNSRAPIIVGVSEGAIHHAGIDFFIWAKEYMKKKYRSSFFLHLDHGRDVGVIMDAIKKGFDSVMIDASHKDFKENVYLTRHVVKAAHRRGVWVEAEIGKIGGAEENVSERKIVFSDPLEAEEFVHRTGCDSLAVSIGTSHGPNKFLGKSHLSFDTLRKIRHLVKVPLVLHGASSIDSRVVAGLKKQGAKISHAKGVSEKDIHMAIKNGIRKVNVDTDLNLVAILEFLKTSKEKGQALKLYKILEEVGDAIEKETIQEIKLFNKK